MCNRKVINASELSHYDYLEYKDYVCEIIAIRMTRKKVIVCIELEINELEIVIFKINDKVQIQ